MPSAHAATGGEPDLGRRIAACAQTTWTPRTQEQRRDKSDQRRSLPANDRHVDARQLDALERRAVGRRIRSRDPPRLPDDQVLLEPCPSTTPGWQSLAGHEPARLHVSTAQPTSVIDSALVATAPGISKLARLIEQGRRVADQRL